MEQFIAQGITAGSDKLGAYATPQVAHVVGFQTAMQLITEMPGRIDFKQFYTSSLEGVKPYLRQAQSLCEFSAVWKTHLNAATMADAGATVVTYLPFKITILRGYGYDYRPHVRGVWISQDSAGGEAWTMPYQTIGLECDVKSLPLPDRTMKIEIVWRWTETNKFWPLPHRPTSTIKIYGDGRFECDGKLATVLGPEGMAALTDLPEDIDFSRVDYVKPPSYRVESVAAATTQPHALPADPDDEGSSSGLLRSAPAGSPLKAAPKADVDKVAAFRGFFLGLLNEDFLGWDMSILKPLFATMSHTLSDSGCVKSLMVFNKQLAIPHGRSVESFYHALVDVDSKTRVNDQLKNLSVQECETHGRQMATAFSALASSATGGFLAVLSSLCEELKPGNYRLSGPDSYDQYRQAGSRIYDVCFTFYEGMSRLVEFINGHLAAVDPDAIGLTREERDRGVTVSAGYLAQATRLITMLQEVITSGADEVQTLDLYDKDFLAQLDEANRRAIYQLVSSGKSVALKFGTSPQTILTMCAHADKLSGYIDADEDFRSRLAMLYTEPDSRAKGVMRRELKASRSKTVRLLPRRFLAPRRQYDLIVENFPESMAMALCEEVERLTGYHVRVFAIRGAAQSNSAVHHEPGHEESGSDSEEQGSSPETPLLPNPRTHAVQGGRRGLRGPETAAKTGGRRETM